MILKNPLESREGFYFYRIVSYLKVLFIIVVNKPYAVTSTLFVESGLS